MTFQWIAAQDVVATPFGAAPPAFAVCSESEKPSQELMVLLPPLYSPSAVTEPWSIEGGEPWAGEWPINTSSFFSATQDSCGDPQRAWDGCVQEIQSCLTIMETLRSSVDRNESRNATTLEAVVERLEKLRVCMLDAPESEETPQGAHFPSSASSSSSTASSFVSFSPNTSPFLSRASSPTPGSSDMCLSGLGNMLQPIEPSSPAVVTKATNSAPLAKTTSTSSSRYRPCEPAPRRDVKRRKTATPADLRKTCEKQLLWTIMKQLKETAPEDFPFVKKDKTKLEDLRSALVAYNGPWGSMVIPQIVQERLAWKLKLNLSPFCRQLIDFLLEHKQGANEGYREMILRIGFVHTPTGRRPHPLKHLLDVDKWQVHRRTRFEIEVVMPTDGSNSSSHSIVRMPLNSRFLPRTSLRTVLEEIRHKVTALPGFFTRNHGGDGEDAIFVVIKIDAPPRRAFLLRSGAECWELSDHSQESTVRVTSDHVACQLMLERSDTTTLVYSTEQQAREALMSLGPCEEAGEPYVSLSQSTPLRHHQGPSSSSSSSSSDCLSLLPPPVASFCDIRRMHHGGGGLVGGISFPEGLANHHALHHHHHIPATSGVPPVPSLVRSTSSTISSTSSAFEPPSPPSLSDLPSITSPTVLSSSCSTATAVTEPKEEDDDEEQDILHQMMMMPILPSLRITVPSASLASHRPPPPGSFSPISFFTSCEPTAMALSDD